MRGGGTLKAKLKRSFNSKLKSIFKARFNFIKEHRAIPILLALIVGLTFGLSRLVLADTVTVKYKDDDLKEQSFNIRKGSVIYLDPNFGYFKKDNNKRAKKLILNTNLDLTNNDDISINPYAVAKDNDPKIDLLYEGHDSIWGQNTTFSSIKTMQEMTPDICDNETTPTKDAINTTAIHSSNTGLVPEARLKDIRDDKYYTVRKLADGKCWMTDNLAYAKVGVLSKMDSDMQDGNFPIIDSDIYTKEGEKWREWGYKRLIYDRREPIYNLTAKPAPKPGFVFDGWRKTRLSNGDISLKAMHDIKTDLPYGNLYTRLIALMGSGTYEEFYTLEGSMCPKGWMLPRNSGTSSYGELFYNFYKLVNGSETFSVKTRFMPLDFPFSGHYHHDDGKVYGVGSRGTYWVFDSYRNTALYRLYKNSDAADAQPWSQSDGFSIRCVVR